MNTATIQRIIHPLVVLRVQKLFQIPLVRTKLNTNQTSHNEFDSSSTLYNYQKFV